MKLPLIDEISVFPVALAGCIATGLVPSIFLGAAIADKLPQRYCWFMIIKFCIYSMRAIDYLFIYFLLLLLLSQF